MNLKHGMGGTKFYKAWQSMHRRCKIYPTYKKIKVDEKWNSFEKFKEDMYQSFLKHTKLNIKTTLERIDNKKGYSKQNCKWATMMEQGRNTSRNRFITYKGEKKTLSEWSRILKIHHMDLHYRIKNWGLKKAMTIPKLDNKTRHLYDIKNKQDFNERLYLNL